MKFEEYLQSTYLSNTHICVEYNVLFSLSGVRFLLVVSITGPYEAPRYALSTPNFSTLLLLLHIRTKQLN